MIDWMIRRYVHIVRWFRSEPEWYTRSAASRERYRILARKAD